MQPMSLRHRVVVYVVGLLSAWCPGDKSTKGRNRKFEIEVRKLEKIQGGKKLYVVGLLSARCPGINLQQGEIGSLKWQ